jgi:hypothetical protein
MNSGTLTSILRGCLAMSLLLSTFFFVQYYFRTSELRRFQWQVARQQQTRAVVTALVKDVLDYSGRNPAIDPLLVSAGIKGAKGPTANPAAK